jgi:hypothetical protein
LTEDVTQSHQHSAAKIGRYHALRDRVSRTPPLEFDTERLDGVSTALIAAWTARKRKSVSGRELDQNCPHLLLNLVELAGWVAVSRPIFV